MITQVIGLGLVVITDRQTLGANRVIIHVLLYLNIFITPRDKYYKKFRDSDRRHSSDLYAGIRGPASGLRHNHLTQNKGM